MSHLNLEPNIADVDAFYEHLIDTHNGLVDADSHALNARLVLLLANHIGDMTVLAEALAKARAGFAGTVPRQQDPRDQQDPRNSHTA
ncbi:DUF2783 domain-containing protein [Paraburkholderia antibiotica]|uniref:DUF2783 domain-containing protein n=1 Tax=Paraburkholderia antibiotica TaxID=2728839 RepID=A0A7X9ZY47_9BURK|nr:DUF2783 domain-containing protein [Paraburkholderia antibiotica]NML30998.1 DUF2783 domain-containing protein [Paraburkholderia antibiotica]